MKTGKIEFLVIPETYENVEITETSINLYDILTPKKYIAYKGEYLYLINSIKIEEKIKINISLHESFGEELIEPHIHDLASPTHFFRRNIILENIKSSSKIYNILSLIDEVHGVIIIRNKETDEPYFLYYVQNGDNFTWRLEVINNVVSMGNKLTPKHDYYRDITYVIEDERAYKIGRAEDTLVRILQLFNGSSTDDIKIVLEMPDGRVEKIWHNLFKDRLLSGKINGKKKKKKEWFKKCIEIRNEIKKQLKLQKEIFNKYDNKNNYYILDRNYK